MALPNEKLAASLAALKRLQKAGRRAFPSSEISRVHRERLLRHGFLQEVMKGWLISASPDARKGDVRYASFWEFCPRYCQARFGHNWHLSPEESLLLHADNTVVRKQFIVYAKKGTNNTADLPFGISLYDLKSKMPSSPVLVNLGGLPIFTCAAALVKVPDPFFKQYPVESQIALMSLDDASEVLGHLREGGNSVVAGRLAGAFRRIGRSEIADEIVSTMKALDYNIHETDPFASDESLEPIRAATPPIVVRLRAMWKSMRETVIKLFPKPPGLPKSKKKYLKLMVENYKNDAWHSLSIEGYNAPPELIDWVTSRDWKADRKNRDALAARGYWQAFQCVKADVSKILSGADPAELAKRAHCQWHREMFQPCVAAGLLRPTALSGYRDRPVFLRTTRYAPPRREIIRDAMKALFELIENEPEPAVRAVLGPWLFGFIHPYADGNGPLARFLMNALLASGGYPWTVIRAEDHGAYFRALDRASIDMDIKPLAKFIAERMRGKK